MLTAPSVLAAPAALPAPAPTHRPRRVAMITHSFYESDARVARYATTLARRGDAVDVFALRRDPAAAAHVELEGVHVHRLQTRADSTTRSGAAHLWPLLRFLVATAWELSRRHAREPYDLVHVHNIPDFLVFAAWFPRLRGAAVVLDIHDIVPELYCSKFGAPATSPVVRVLKWIERRAARFAHHVIVSNHLWHETFSHRTATVGRCSVFINHVDDRVFRPGLRTRTDGRFIILFPGGLQWHQGLDLAVCAFGRITALQPAAEFHVYGDGVMKPELLALTRRLGLEDRIRFFPPVSNSEIARIMANADLGVVPKRADSFGNEAYSTKIMEFMSLGVPVVVSRTRIDQHYFNDDVVRFFESGNITDLAAALQDLLADPARRAAQAERGLAYARRHRWALRQAEYLALVDRLTGSARHVA